MFIDKKPSEVLLDYIDIVKPHLADPDYPIQPLVKDMIKFVNSGFKPEDQEVTHKRIEKQWYDSLSTGDPDYSVYGTDFYMVEAWVCWMIYSRRYIRDLHTKGWLSSVDPKVIVDLGCGTGLTTAAFKDLCPNAEVIGTNIPDTNQWYVASHYAKEFNFTLREFFHTIESDVDVVFASEYFEHIEDSIPHLKEVINTLRPEYLVVANGYSGTAIGHFNVYQPDNIPSEKMPKIFSKTMKSLRYEIVDTGFFNNRPQIWKKLGEESFLL